MAHINPNFAGRNGSAPLPPPSMPPQWYRCVDGSTHWEALCLLKFIGTDVPEIDRLISSVQSGTFHPNPRFNPYKKVLSSGRKLTFQWAVNPSSHTIDVWNIRLQGKTNTALLMKF
jgi:hypothetical protein